MFPTSVYCENSEKAIMLNKAALMKDMNNFQKLLKNSEPNICKSIGRCINPFNQEKWNNHINEIAFSVLYDKFTSTEELKNNLLSTNESILVEATNLDKIWGCGININDPLVYKISEWKGTNILGYTLMKVRTVIKKK